MPMRWASSSRWYVASPRRISEDLARLKYKCALCSQVKPIPPWIWMFSAAAWKYASEQYAFARLATTGTSSLPSGAAQPGHVVGPNPNPLPPIETTQLSPALSVPVVTAGPAPAILAADQNLDP